MYKVRRSADLDVLTLLQLDIFPNDEMYNNESMVFWISYDSNMVPVGFAILKEINGDSVYFTRAGVSMNHRGKGLHRRMVAARLRYAKRNGYKNVITYTIYDNAASSNTLIKSGFLRYEPQYKWVEKVLFYIKEL